jgi:hypothetical protein
MIIQKHPHKGIFYHRATIPEEPQFGGRRP